MSHEWSRPEQHWIDAGTHRLRAYEWGNPGEPQVVLAHATGFHGRCWDQVVAALPRSCHVIAVDARGHGQSDKLEPYSWAAMAEDLEKVLAYFNVQQAVGVGHSMGGHLVTHVCAKQPKYFSRLLLVDPVIFPPEAYADRKHQMPSVEEHPVSRRNAHFESWEAMYERFADRRPYSLWQPAVLRDYCRYGVLPSAGGEGVDLACPGPVEAAVYTHNFGTDIFPLLPQVQVPVTILRAPPGDPDRDTMDFSASPTWPDLAKAFPDAQDVYLQDMTHFIPMQDPGLVAGYIAKSL